MISVKRSDDRLHSRFGGVVVWKAISYKLQFLTLRIIVYSFQYNNDPSSTEIFLKSCVYTQNVEVLQQLLYCPHVILIGNVLKWVAKKVYDDNNIIQKNLIKQSLVHDFIKLHCCVIHFDSQSNFQSPFEKRRTGTIRICFNISHFKYKDKIIYLF